MRRASLLLLVLALAACRHASQAPGPAAPAQVSFGEVAPLLGKYCFACHGNGKAKGQLALDAFTSPERARADRDTWQNVLEHLESAQMPPEDEPQPSVAERRRLTT